MTPTNVAITAEVIGQLDSLQTAEGRPRQAERTQAHLSAADLANIRFEGGVTSYREVFYNEQELFFAELGLARARLNELLSVVALYRSLGGGWQLKDSALSANR